MTRGDSRIDRDVAIAIDHAAVRIATTWYAVDEPRYDGISVGDLIAYDLVPWLIAALKGLARGENVLRVVATPRDGAAPRPLSRRAAMSAFDLMHRAANIAAAARHSVGPGFHRPPGIRTIFFDPYVGYDGLLPELFGTTYERALVPRPNVRRMPEIRRVQRTLGVRTEFGQPLPADPDEQRVADALGAVKASAAAFRLTDAADVPGLDKAWPEIMQQLQANVESRLRTACAQIAGARHFVRRENVDAAVLPFDEFGMYKALALVARDEGLFSVRYQHGVANAFPAFVAPTSAKLILWDDAADRLYSRLGVARERIARLENPMRAALERARMGRDGAAAIRTRHGLASDARVVLFAGSPFVGLSALEEREEIDTVLRDVARAVRADNASWLVVKPHPHDATREGLERIQRVVADEMGSRGLVLPQADTRELVLASDVVIGETSTVLWEASVLGRHAIGYVARPFVREVFAHEATSGVRTASSVDELTRAIAAARASDQTHIQRDTEQVEVARASYFQDPRWEVASLVPASARRVLDIGCGAGWIGSHVKRVRPAWVAGIEYDAGAADVARRVLDRVDVADLDTYEPPYEPASFDCMIFADVLEHLRDPDAVLRRFVPLLSANGTVVLSIPNVSHYSVALPLLRSRWDYADEGLLDRTHLRFFTRAAVDRLVRNAGLVPIHVAANTAASRTMRVLAKLTGGAMNDLLVFQYLVVAARPDSVASRRNR